MLLKPLINHLYTIIIFLKWDSIPIMKIMSLKLINLSIILILFNSLESFSIILNYIEYF